MSGLNQRVCGSGVVHHREGTAPAAGRRDGVLRRTANHTHHRRRFPGVPMDYWSTGWRNVVDAIGVFQTPEWSTCSVHVFCLLCFMFYILWRRRRSMVCDIYPRNWQMDHGCDGREASLCRYIYMHM